MEFAAQCFSRGKGMQGVKNKQKKNNLGTFDGHDEFTKSQTQVKIS